MSLRTLDEILCKAEKEYKAKGRKNVTKQASVWSAMMLLVVEYVLVGRRPGESWGAR